MGVRDVQNHQQNDCKHALPVIDMWSILAWLSTLEKSIIECQRTYAFENFGTYCKISFQ